MVNILFKKSYLHKTFDEVSYDSLWGTKGVFTTIRLIGNPPKLIFFKHHINNLNHSLKKMDINFNLTLSMCNFLIYSLLNNSLKYDHLLRIAVNTKKISFSLRKRNKINKSFQCTFVDFKRKNSSIKNLYYLKILSLINSINSNKCEVILTNKKRILEGCTTNFILVKKNKLYIPKNNYYFGITLKFIKKHTKRKIFKKDIFIKDLSLADEILLVGSGKGIVKIPSIPQIMWNNKSNAIFNELQDLYNSYINK